MARLGCLTCLLFVVVAADAIAQSLPVRHYGMGEGLIHDIVGRVSIDSHGFLWAATVGGVSRFDGYGFVNYTATHGLPDVVVNHVYEDLSGRMWVATNGGLARFRTQPDERGRLFDVFAVGSSKRSNRVNRLLEIVGRLWAATDEGLFQASARRAEPVFTFVSLGIADPTGPEVAIFDIAEGSGGTVWLATSLGLVHRLANGRSVRYVYRGSRAGETARLVVIGPDQLVWVTYSDALVVWRLASSDQPYPDRVTADRVPCATARSAIVMPAAFGTACIMTSASSAGGSRRPVVTTTLEGSVLASWPGQDLIEIRRQQETRPIWVLPKGLTLHNLAEDRQGHMWAATDDGLFRLVRSGIRVSRFTPQAERTQRPPGIRIGSLRVAGTAVPLSPLGAELAEGIRTDVSRSRIEIEFFGLDESLDGTLRYQTRLEGAEREWSQASAKRTVTYASLPPGRYRFHVRAVNSAGQASARPAAVSFVVRQPLWQRWWFLTGASFAFAGFIYLLYGYRRFASAIR